MKQNSKIHTQIDEIKDLMHELASSCGRLNHMNAIFPLEEAYAKLDEVEQILYDNEELP